MPDEEKKPITHSVLPENVIRQRQWGKDELRAMGYEYYERKREVPMVRELPASEAPLTIHTHYGDTLVAEAGYMICYSPGKVVCSSIDQYDHWPVAPEIFIQTYSRWDEPNWKPSPPQRHLLAAGCRPFYKSSGIWAKKLDTDVYLQSKEHVKPVKIRTGMYVAIGQDGEPYSMGDNTIHSRYRPQRNTLLSKIKRLFRGK
jgi:hypothetical protein